MNIQEVKKYVSKKTLKIIDCEPNIGFIIFVIGIVGCAIGIFSCVVV